MSVEYETFHPSLSLTAMLGILATLSNYGKKGQEILNHTPDGMYGIRNVLRDLESLMITHAGLKESQVAKEILRLRKHRRYPIFPLHQITEKYAIDWLLSHGDIAPITTVPTKYLFKPRYFMIMRHHYKKVLPGSVIAICFKRSEETLLPLYEPGISIVIRTEGPRNIRRQWDYDELHRRLNIPELLDEDTGSVVRRSRRK